MQTGETWTRIHGMIQDIRLYGNINRAQTHLPEGLGRWGICAVCSTNSTGRCVKCTIIEQPRSALALAECGFALWLRSAFALALCPDLRTVGKWLGLLSNGAGLPP